MDLDQDTIKQIAETHTNVAWLKDDAEAMDQRASKLEGRVRRIENYFVPVVAVIGVGTHKVIAWLKL